MGMCTSGDIFQAKVEKTLGDIKGVNTYIDDTLVLSKDIFYEHIEQLRIFFGGLRAAGLKVDGPKRSFGLKNITCLGYIKTGEGIKPDPNKFQAIMDPGRPTTATETQALISMVQYYRDMCPRQSHILAPMTGAAIGSKCKKLEWHTRRVP